MQREKGVMDAARVGDAPRNIPRVLLDRLQRSTLVGAHRVFAPDVSSLIDRAVKLVEEAPAVARSFQLVMRVGVFAVSGDSLQNFRRLVGAGEDVTKHVGAGWFDGKALA